MTDLRKLKLGLAILAILIATGCNAITQPPAQYNPGSFAADFTDASGNASYFISTDARASLGVSDYSVSASQSNAQGTFDIYLAGITTSSILPYTVTSSQYPSFDVKYYDAANNETYEANQSIGTCTVKITQTSPTLQGSELTATLISRGIADSVRYLTNGSFNAAFN